VLVLLLLVYCGRLSAKPVSAEKAQQAVKGWLKADSQPLGAVLGQKPEKIDAFSDEQGQVIYYVVYLQPSGFVIVPADDMVEPILGFAEAGTYDPSPDNPLWVLVNGDVKKRISAGRDVLTVQGAEALQKTTSKWNRLTADSPPSQGPVTESLITVSDPRVDPLLKTKWSQTTCCNTPARSCYNYYTPPSDPCDPCDNLIESLHGSPNNYGNPNNFPCGCVATAMAQLMRYHAYPTAGIGKHQFQIQVNGIPQTAWTRGGNGNGGPYDLNSMVYEPNCNTTLTQRKAIGALCYDAGVTVGMDYAAAGSRAPMASTKTALKNTFTYSNAFYKNSINPGIPLPVPDLIKMINPNLDYEHSVLVSIMPMEEGHAVVVDGYGYTWVDPNWTMYHHINMGWAGDQDAWYNFYSDMPTGSTYIDCCVYNIFVTGTNEIISGRVTDASGNALAGETVTAVRTGGGTYQATTNNRGIYALAHVPSASTYTISVTKPGYDFASQVVSNGTSADAGTIGDLWAVDFKPFGADAIFVDANATGSNDGSSWTNAYKYLQDAISAASSGKIILVAAGTYKPDADSVNPSGDGDRFKSFKLQSGVAIYGGFPSGGCNSWADRNPQAHPSILSGDLAGNDVDVDYPCQFKDEPTRAENSFHVVDGNNTAATAVLDGFTITAGDANGDMEVLSDVYDMGGGMINADANCTVRNCTFLKNYAYFNGGGMFNWRSDVNVSNCVFFRNSAMSGGGMGNYGDAVFVGDDWIPVNGYSKITNCTFYGNWAAFWGLGGVNYWSGAGGGMSNVQNSYPTITNCTFLCNTAGQYGGGMFNEADSGVKLINCTFSSNLGELNGWLDYGGGGIYNYSVNYAPNYIANCIFWGNRDASGTTETAQIKSNYYCFDVNVVYSCIQDNNANDGYIPFGGDANHNIDDNPMFIRDPYDGGDNRWGDANDDYGNLRLAAGSPCIDKGDNNSVPADTADLDNDANTVEQTPLDIDLHSRFVDGDPNSAVVVDMGAYEFSWVFAGDFDGDADVDFADFAILAASWLQNNPALDIAPPPAGDGIVDLKDFAVLFDNWLAGK
jgi:hypothetical protein